jgi:hypothetical protein
VLSAVQDSAVDLVEKIHQNECVEAKGVKNKSISRLEISIIVKNMRFGGDKVDRLSGEEDLGS